MAKNDDMNGAFDFNEWRWGELTPEYVVEKIVNAKQQLYMDYININERAKKGGRVTSDDFKRAESRYNGEILDIINHLPKYYSGASAMRDSEKAFSIWQQKQNNLPEISDIEPLNKIFAQDYLAHAKPKDTLLSPGTNTTQDFFAQQLSNSNGIAFAGINNDSAEIELVTKNMGFFRENNVRSIYLIGHTDDVKKYKDLSLEKLRIELEDISEKMEKTPSLLPSYAEQKQDKAIVSLLISAWENRVRIKSIGNKWEAGEFESSLSGEHRVASTNFTLTDRIKNDSIMSVSPEKYVIIGSLENFIATSAKANGKIDEALAVPVIALRSGDNHQPLIEQGSSANGPDFYLRTHACRPDTKGLAIAGDYNDLSKAIIKNIDRIQSKEEVMEAIRYAAILDKKAEHLRSDYIQSLEVCDIPTREAKAPATTPPVQVASNRHEEITR